MEFISNKVQLIIKRKEIDKMLDNKLLRLGKFFQIIYGEDGVCFHNTFLLGLIERCLEEVGNFDPMLLEVNEFVVMDNTGGTDQNALETMTKGLKQQVNEKDDISIWIAREESHLMTLINIEVKEYKETLHLFLEFHASLKNPVGMVESIEYTNRVRSAISPSYIEDAKEIFLQKANFICEKIGYSFKQNFPKVEIKEEFLILPNVSIEGVFQELRLATTLYKPNCVFPSAYYNQICKAYFVKDIPLSVCLGRSYFDNYFIWYLVYCYFADDIQVKDQFDQPIEKSQLADWKDEFEYHEISYNRWLELGYDLAPIDDVLEAMEYEDDEDFPEIPLFDEEEDSGSIRPSMAIYSEKESCAGNCGCGDKDEPCGCSQGGECNCNH